MHKKEALSLPSRRRKGEKDQFTSYYQLPILKKAHWSWQIWFYFWVGGIAAGASIIAALTEIFGDKKRDRSVIQAGRYISLAGLIISPVLLILDLQRPERFLHMLRVLKLRSPLSVGTYILTSTGVLSGLNAARQTVKDGIIPENSLLGKLALNSANGVTSSLQGVGGLALGSYTGVLLSATATPLWAENDTVLGPLFLSSALSNGAAAISLTRALAGVSKEELHRLDNLERLAILSELTLLTYGTAKLKPEVRKFVTSGKYLPFFSMAVLQGMLIPLVLSLFGSKGGKHSRFTAIFSSLMVLMGGFWLRFAIVEAGKASTQDPHAYHAITQE